VSGHNRYLDDQGDVEVDETMAVRIDSLLSVVKVEKHDTMHLSDVMYLTHSYGRDEGSRHVNDF
jgi:hypothetical protein